MGVANLDLVYPSGIRSPGPRPGADAILEGKIRLRPWRRNCPWIVIPLAVPLADEKHATQTVFLIRMIVHLCQATIRIIIVRQRKQAGRKNLLRRTRELGARVCWEKIFERSSGG